MCAAMIVDDLQSWGDSRFLDAIREHRKASNFLPTTSDLIKADAVTANRLPELVALPEAPVDPVAYAATARKWLEKIRSVPGFGNITPQDAEPVTRKQQ